MITVERIQSLVERHNMTAAQLLRETKLNPASITQWKKGIAKPSFDAIIKISDYFNVTTDYLLGRTNNLTPPDSTAPYVSPNELTIIDKLRTLPPEKRKAIETLLD